MLGAGDERTQEQSVHSFQSSREEGETVVQQTRRETHCSGAAAVGERGQGEEPGEKLKTRLCTGKRRSKRNFRLVVVKLLLGHHRNCPPAVCLTPRIRGWGS